jgi:DNA-binding LacI/PurR family transcriptional regulator
MVYLSFNYSPHVPWNELHLPRVLHRHDVIRAVILAGPNSANLIKLLEDEGISFVLLGNNVVGEQQDLTKNDAVFADDIQGGQDATRYLIDLGHRQFGLLAIPACRGLRATSRVIGAPWKKKGSRPA